MTRIFALGEVNKYLSEFGGRKLSKFDKILLKGFYVKRQGHPDDLNESDLSPAFFDQKRGRRMSTKETFINMTLRPDQSLRIDTNNQLLQDNSVSLKTRKKLGR